MLHKLHTSNVIATQPLLGGLVGGWQHRVDLTDFGKMPQTSPNSFAKIPRGAALLLPRLRGLDAARPGGAQRSAVEKREAGGLTMSSLWTQENPDFREVFKWFYLLPWTLTSNNLIGVSYRRNKPLNYFYLRNILLATNVLITNCLSEQKRASGLQS